MAQTRANAEPTKGSKCPGETQGNSKLGIKIEMGFKKKTTKKNQTKKNKTALLSSVYLNKFLHGIDREQR